MAKTPPSAGRPGRQLIVLSLVSIILFALTFFSGTAGMSWIERLEPRLGMDLVGGTRVTLLAATEGGQTPSQDSLERAREIIESRVNALGVEEAEVVTEGDNRIVVSVAGEPENALRSVGDPAELRFRKVLDQDVGWDPTAVSPEAEDEAEGEEGDAEGEGESSDTPEPETSASPEASDAAESEESDDTGGTGGQADTTDESAEEGAPEDELGGTGDWGTVEERRQAVRDKISDEAMAAAMAIVDPNAADPTADTDALLEAIRPFAELTGPEVAVLPAKLQFYLPTITCAQLNARPAGSIADPDELAVACDEAGTVKYLLDVSKVLGTDVSGADAVLQAGTTRWEIVLQFTSSGQPKWTDLTREAIQNSAATPFDITSLAMDVVIDEETGQWRFDSAAAEQANRYQEQTEDLKLQCGAQSLGNQGNCLVAAVLDNRVISAPEIQSVITGDARITGDFTVNEAQVLASQLRFGALPLTFEPQEEQSISATLGVEYLKAGLLAAAIGMALVVLYVFFYYRLLGVVILGSLVISSVLTYAALVVLGRGIGYTLTLAGIAGFIVAVGIAADSFVIYFERLKDEIREGRTPRSAVPRAWIRARRTIITANAVTLMAAVVLYLLSAGQVRGFAFALGLATVLDLLVVFTFRHPIMTLLARSRAFLSPTVSGLGRALEMDRAQRARLRAQAREVEA